MSEMTLIAIMTVVENKMVRLLHDNDTGKKTLQATFASK